MQRLTITNLQGQHRVGDERYLQFLDHIRHWIPQHSLSDLQDGHLITEEGEVTDDHIMEAYRMHTDTTVLPFTRRAANHINDLMTARLFHVAPLVTAQLDNDLPPTNIYAGMRIVITQNRDKANVVNTVFLKLPTGKFVNVYPVTSLKDGQQQTVYPFFATYTTMCKAQVQTLQEAVLWFDIDRISPGTAYVALSRVKTLNIYFLIPLRTKFFTPVTRDSHLL